MSLVLPPPRLLRKDNPQVWALRVRQEGTFFFCLSVIRRVPFFVLCIVHANRHPIPFATPSNWAWDPSSWRKNDVCPSVSSESMQQTPKSNKVRPPIQSETRSNSSPSQLIDSHDMPFVASALLHDHTAPTALLGRVRVLALGHDAPDRWYHVVAGAVAVADDAATNRQLGRRRS